MKFVFVVANDAYLRGAINIIDSLNHDINVEIYTTQSMLIKENVYFFDINDLNSCGLIFDSDALFLGMGGKNLNKIIKKSREIKSGSKIIGYFPGIVHYNILEALSTRLLCDLVLLNSRSDFEIYRAISEKVLGYNNGVVFGAPWVLKDRVINRKPEIDLLFVEQSIVPHSLALRRKLLKSLCELADRNREKRIVIALRARKGEETSHEVIYPLDDFDFVRIPSNLEFSYSDVYEMIDLSERVATISSSAAYISIVQGKSTYFISDFGDRRKYGNDFFKKSGYFYKLCQIFMVTPKPNDWGNRNIQEMDTIILKIFPEIRKNNLSFIPGFHIAKFGNFIKFLMLGFERNQSISSIYKLYKSISNINSKIYRL